MAQGRTFEDGQRARELFDAGRSCNAIARELGVSASTISAWAKREGLTFPSERVVQAAEAHRVSAAERRAKIIGRLQSRAEKNLDRLEAPKYKTRIVTGEGSLLVEDDDPMAADELRHSQAIANYMKTARDLEALDNDGGVAEGAALLISLGKALGVIPND